MKERTESSGTEPTAATTRWQRVMDDAEWQGPLSELAASYYYCAYVWWRRAGLDAERAATGTVASFNRWLTDARPTRDQPGAARLRRWLPQQLAKLAADGVKLTAPPAITIDTAWCERRYAVEPPGEPDAIFARRWALTMLEFSALAMRKEYEARGEEALFPELIALAGAEDAGKKAYAEVATRVGRTVEALDEAVQAFRKRQREILLSLARDTLLDPTQAESEIAAFLAACDAPGPAGAGAAMPTVIRSVRPEVMLARAMQSVKASGGDASELGAPTVEEVARLFPQYEVLALLGRGGMGAVYKARQPSLDRTVAIKLLPLEVSADPAFAGRFEREARTMAKLQHQNIVAVYDSGKTAEGHLYLVMEYIEGANLHAVIYGPGLAPEKALEIASGICDALAYAHGQGVVHRDIKPANVRVSAGGQVKVADFGFAQITAPPAEKSKPAHTGWTLKGVVVGTADYIAPEQRRGKPVDHRADLYSTGVTLYEMLCREVPQGVFEKVSARVKVDPRIDDVVSKALQQQPDRRYQSADDMKADLTAVRTGAPFALAATAPVAEAAASATGPAKRSGPSPALLVAAGVAMLALVVGGFHFLGGKKAAPADASASTGKAQPEAKPAGASGESATVLSATIGHPFVNSLGMKFVPAPVLGGPTGGARVLFSVWDTRVQDYEAFAAENKRDWPKPSFEQGPTHPAVNVSWEDAELFCNWLTARDQAAKVLPANWLYRLPTDHEWSCAADLGAREDPEKLPGEKDGKIGDAFAWGPKWPPEGTPGNYASEELKPLQEAGKFKDIKGLVAGYRDGFANTSPVGSYVPNRFGLYDMSGNVWQWCEDWFDLHQKERVLRGGSWRSADARTLLLPARVHGAPSRRNPDYGFRFVAVENGPAEVARLQRNRELADAAAAQAAAAKEVLAAKAAAAKAAVAAAKPAGTPPATVVGAKEIAVNQNGKPAAANASAPAATPAGGSSGKASTVAEKKPPVSPVPVATAQGQPGANEQALAPELVPVVAKYKAGLAAIDTQRKAALASAQQEYLAALDFADKSAGAAGDLARAGQIERERQLVATQPENAARSAGELPETLAPARKRFLAAQESAKADQRTREQQADSDYLRTLTIIQAQAAAGSPLAGQIAAEKAALIRKSDEAAEAAGTHLAPTTSEGPGTDLVAPHGDALTNGNFAVVDAKGLPVGWKLYGGLEAGGVFPNGVAIKTEKDHDLSFVRMTFEGRYHNFGFDQQVYIPNGKHTALVKIRYRGKITGRLDTGGRNWPNFILSFYDESGYHIDHIYWNPHNVALETAFVTYERTITIPKGAVSATFHFSNGNCNGVFDFTQASTQFR